MRISVAVPVRNEASSIRILLDLLLRQTLKPVEIILADGGPKDATPQIIEEFIANDAPVRLLREKEAMPGRARNIAAAHFQHDWIAFIDAGNTPASDWLANLAQKVIDDPAVDAAYGSNEPVIDSSFKKCAVIAYVPPAANTAEEAARLRSIVCTDAAQSVQDMGGFPEHLRSAEGLLFANNGSAGISRAAGSRRDGVSTCGG